MENISLKKSTNTTTPVHKVQVNNLTGKCRFLLGPGGCGLIGPAPLTSTAGG